VIRIAFIIVFALTTTIGFSQQADDIIGKYRLPNKLDIEIFKVDNKYFGKIIALNGYENGQTVDVKNPEKTKQDDPLLEMVIIKNLRYDAKEKKWLNGKMYGPEKGMVFNLKIVEIGKSKVTVVGSKYLFWHTMEWEKI
jgi:uncharacterized protein (DUF2147 family)